MRGEISLACFMALCSLGGYAQRKDILERASVPDKSGHAALNRLIRAGIIYRPSLGMYAIKNTSFTQSVKTGIASASWISAEEKSKNE